MKTRMRRAALALCCAALLPGVVVACAEGRAAPDGAEAVSRCGECHAEPGGVALPVPPHDVHPMARDGILADCAACHEVPATVEAVGHLEDRGVDDVRLGALASLGGLTPSYDGATCRSVYCHGATLAGGRLTAPTWERRDAPLACDACHGNPPPRPHPQEGACTLCHAESVGDDGEPRPDTHPNGEVELIRWTGAEGQPACGACHGVPPSAPHPQVEQCALCHGGAYDAAGALDPEQHVDGEIDMGGATP